mgnify:CR=1 FL=1
MIHVITHKQCDQGGIKVLLMPRLCERNDQGKMPFNIDKCEVITFSKAPTAAPQYFLGNGPLECVNLTTYLAMEMQSNLKFDKHIASKIKSAWKNSRPCKILSA